MPRVSAAEKARSHAKIIEAASHLFRQRGLEATSVSDVMGAAGLTHGGFYRHFRSKDDLIRAAFRRGVDDALEQLEKAQSDNELSGALNAYINTYLSLEHVENGQRGCVLAALAAEAARDEGAAKDAATEATERVISALTNAIGGQTKQGRDDAVKLFSLLVGTVSVARIAGSREEQEAILEVGRKAVAFSVKT